MVDNSIYANTGRATNGSNNNEAGGRDIDVV